LLTGALKQLVLTVPVESLKSKEAALDKNMYKAMKTQTFPEIVFQLVKYDVVPSTTSAGVSRITASGTLRITGVAQPVVLNMDAEPVNGVLRVRGQYTLLMTDYGIKPPTMMLGTIKVRNPVVIHFDLGLR
jgi:polyisoprenoid-binding protein YceI